MIINISIFVCDRIISSLHQPYPQHHPSSVRPVNAETFHHTSDKSGARAYDEEAVVLCFGQFGVSGILPLDSRALSL